MWFSASLLTVSLTGHWLAILVYGVEKKSKIFKVGTVSIYRVFGITIYPICSKIPVITSLIITARDPDYYVYFPMQVLLTDIHIHSYIG